MSSDPGALDNYRTSNHVVDSPVVLKEEERDECWEKEGNGEVLVQGSDRGPAEEDMRTGSRFEEELR